MDKKKCRRIMFLFAGVFVISCIMESGIFAEPLDISKGYNYKMPLYKFHLQNGGWGFGVKYEENSLFNYRPRIFRKHLNGVMKQREVKAEIFALEDGGKKIILKCCSSELLEYLLTIELKENEVKVTYDFTILSSLTRPELHLFSTIRIPEGGELSEANYTYQGMENIMEAPTQGKVLDILRDNKEKISNLLYLETYPLGGRKIHYEYPSFSKMILRKYQWGRPIPEGIINAWDIRVYPDFPGYNKSIRNNLEAGAKGKASIILKFLPLKEKEK